MKKQKPRTWLDIFFASVRRGDDPCYAMWLADEWQKRKAKAREGGGE